MKEYYSAKDIQKITECSKSMAYDIIRKLREKFSQEYPDAITIQGKIPIWYFEKIMMNKER
jgi:hypothetical protein